MNELRYTTTLPDVDGTPNRTQGALLASVFSPVTLRELSREQFGGHARRLAILGELVRSRPEATLAEAFDAARDLLARGYRSEYVFKNDIVSRAVFGRHSPRTASALIEQPMGASIADVVVLNGTTTVYEVKTDLDDFTRLPAQLRDYRSRAEHVYVVTSVGRAAEAAAIAPDDVGVLALRRRGNLSTIRQASSNIGRLVPQHLFELLRTPERQDALRITHGYTPNPHQGHGWDEMQHLFAELSPQIAHDRALEQLRKRAKNVEHLVNSPTFPASLRALAYAAPTSAIGARRIEHRLSQPAATFRLVA
ncbi:sce7726 family protein [Curtobacterium sp. MCBA15_012]|uniref:sce7726 family protein n=1 Tax=Curtobacterium sp. MCBA15_012 TaxID=1898738 RepID=UPI0011145871|nr:sce7726 family protein [Curtobacterium sp. MCBA15_012]WIB00316.1 sce7726 family protein [Curtobacterium sp. MCBA15_012]